MSDRYVGIDLAAQPRRTGLAVLVIDAGGEVVVEQVGVGATDDDLLAAMHGARMVGVDVPLGWPEGFVDLLAAHAEGQLEPPVSTGDAWRRNLAMRATDRVVHARTGITPLSVSTDKIAHPALRWAGIEARLREQGIDVSRDGSGLICEVYPSAALRCLGLPFRGYKGAENIEARASLITALETLMPWTAWSAHREICTADDNALDAVISARLALQVAQGDAVPPPEELQDLARREGWIWLPRSVAGAKERSSVQT